MHYSKPFETRYSVGDIINIQLPRQYVYGGSQVEILELTSEYAKVRSLEDDTIHVLDNMIYMEREK